MSSHAKAAKKFIADRERTAWHDQALFFVREKRDRMARDVPEWEALREMASNMKRHTTRQTGFRFTGRKMPRNITGLFTRLSRNMGERIS